MKTLSLPLLLVCLATASTVLGADLSKINRAIAKEPAYQSKPRYCLLVFGPEAKTRVWLVQDGETLYVDRNGNGDLTEASKRVLGKGNKPGNYLFEVGEVQDGNRTHTKLEVGVGELGDLAEALRDLPDYNKLVGSNPKVKAYTVTVEVAMPGRRGAGRDGRVEQMVFLFDSQGILQFGDRPQDAPIIHFGGPWSMTTYGKQSLRLDQNNDLVVGFGTPGLGAGTFAYVVYEELVPKGVSPVVDIAFPAKTRDGKTPRARFVLDHRC
jgi:hypothetical protein